jgi:hypothetical protein
MTNEQTLYNTVETIKTGDLVALTRNYFTDAGELFKGETLRVLNIDDDVATVKYDDETTFDVWANAIVFCESFKLSTF